MGERSTKRLVKRERVRQIMTEKWGGKIGRKRE